jgi:hypothetical protein
LRLLLGEGSPVGGEAITVPGFGKSQTLRKGKGRAARKFPSATPAGDVIFRPEEEHGLSRKDNVFVPARGRDSEVYNASCSEKMAFSDGQLHSGIAAGTCGGDESVATEHCGNGESIPDATGPPGVIAGLHVERGGNGPEGSGAENFRSAFLEHQDVQAREALQSGAHGFWGIGNRSGEFAEFGNVTAGNDETIERVTKSGIGFVVDKSFGHGKLLLSLLATGLKTRHYRLAQLRSQTFG